MVKKPDEFQQQVELYKNQLMQLHRKVLKTQETQVKPKSPGSQNDLPIPIDHGPPAHTPAPNRDRNISTEQSKDVPQDHVSDQFADPERFHEEDANNPPVDSPAPSVESVIPKEGDAADSPVHMLTQCSDLEMCKDRNKEAPTDLSAETEQSRNSKPPPMCQQGQYDILSQTDIDMNYLKNGFLQIHTTVVGMALPLSGARCVISKLIDGKKRIYHNVLTDENGRTEELSLPAPDKCMTGAPANDGPLPYGLYNLEVMKDGFKRICNFNIPIFDGILSVQDVNMIPLADSDDASEEIILDESYQR